MRRSHRLLLIPCAALLATVVWSAETTPAGPAGPRVYVGFDTEVTRGTKDVGGPTAHGGTGATPLLAGEKGVSWVSFGSSGHTEDWCTAGIGAAPGAAQLKDKMLQSSANLWWGEYTLVSVSPEKIVVALDWERWSAGKKIGGDHRALELKSGEAHTLDFANADLSGKGPVCVRSVIVRLVAEMADDSAAANR